jgi:hypothetical protein
MPEKPSQSGGRIPKPGSPDHPWFNKKGKLRPAARDFGHIKLDEKLRGREIAQSQRYLGSEITREILAANRREFISTFEVDKEGNACLDLTDLAGEGREGTHPIRFLVRVNPDNNTVVYLQHPGKAFKGVGEERLFRYIFAPKIISGESAGRHLKRGRILEFGYDPNAEGDKERVFRRAVRTLLEDIKGIRP